MLFSFWQLKTTLSILSVASCVGQELFRSCKSDCYEESVEFRAVATNDSQKWNESLEREESILQVKKQDDNVNRRAIENDEYRFALRDFDNQRLSRDNHRQRSKMVQLQAISDVTRHLVNRISERREIFQKLHLQIGVRTSDDSNNQRHFFKQLNEHADTSQERLDRYDASRGVRENERSSDDNRCHFSRTSNNARENQRVEDPSLTEQNLEVRYYETSQRQVDRFRQFYDREEHRDSRLRSGVVCDLQRMEAKCLINNEMEKKQDGYKTQRYINGLSVREQNHSTRSEDSRKAKHGNVSRFNECETQRNLESHSKSNREGDSYTLRTLDSREVGELRRRFNNEEIIKALTRFDDHETQHNTVYREHYLTRFEFSNFKQELARNLEHVSSVEPIVARVQYISDREERCETLKRMNYAIRLENENNLRLADNVEIEHRTHRIKRQLPQKNFDLVQRDTREVIRSLEQNSPQEKYLCRRSDVIRASQCSITRENESQHCVYDNSPNGYQRLKISKRINNREVRTEDSRRLHYKPEEHGSTSRRIDAHEKQDTSRRSESMRKEQKKALRQLETKIDVSDRHSLERRDDRPAQYKIISYSERNKREASKMFEDSEIRNLNRHLYFNRDERYQIRRHSEQRKVNQRPINERETQRVKVQILQRERESIQRRNENNPKQIERYEVFKRSDVPSTQFKRRTTNFNFNKEDYTQKTNVFLSNGYIIFGQSAILAYVIIKTLNGNTDLKNYLSIKLREATEIYCF